MGKVGREKEFIEIEGLDSLMNRLHVMNPKLEKALKKGLKEAAGPVLDSAKDKARHIAYRGRKLKDKDKISYMDSLSLAPRNSGLVYVLKSTDPAAGVKEYAHEGATRLVGPSSRSSTQKKRKRMGLPLGPGLREVKVGVPHRANPPRVMIPAVEGSADEARERIEAHVAKIIEEAANG